jgi:hypothetical protein
MILRPNNEDAQRIISHPSIYPHVRDDGSCDPDDFVIPDEVMTIVVYDPDPVACIMFHWRNSIMVEGHIQVLPEARKHSFDYGKAMVAWIFDNIAIDKLVGLVHDRQTLLYTLKLGFKEEGVCSASFLSNGQLIDQTHIGIERCQQQSHLSPH